MFQPLFATLVKNGVPVSLREYLSLLAGLEAGIVDGDPEGFYYLCRSALVKDERHMDRFDRAFAECFRGLEALPAAEMLRALDLPEDWLERQAELYLSEEERDAIATAGGFQALMQQLRDRLKEQAERHEGGSKWIGTAGTSPFGAYGAHPEGVRMGQDRSRQSRAVKVWDRRDFRDFDDQQELGTRNMKMALRRLRVWAREGAEEELDLPGTIRATAEHGHLDVKTRPERRNAVKLLLFLDVGGSMDPHVRQVETLFSAARSEFRHLEAFYFHNCIYEGVWRDNRRRWEAQIPTLDLLHRFGSDYRCIVVGDAAMSPYEIVFPGGANEHWNPEAGEVWLRRVTAQWPRTIWLNPLPLRDWGYTRSVGIIQSILGEERMLPLTPAGIAQGTRMLSQ